MKTPGFAADLVQRLHLVLLVGDDARGVAKQHDGRQMRPAPRLVEDGRRLLRAEQRTDCVDEARRELRWRTLGLAPHDGVGDVPDDLLRQLVGAEGGRRGVEELNLGRHPDAVTGVPALLAVGHVLLQEEDES